MNETTAVNKFLYEQITADPTLQGLVGDRVYMDIPPPQSSFPLIIVGFLASTPLHKNGGGILLHRLIYSVQAVGAGDSYAPLSAIAGALDTCLVQSYCLSQDGYTFENISKQSALQYTETVDDRHFKHLGGIYAILVQVGEL
jgi:hypothetical protein